MRFLVLAVLCVLTVSGCSRIPFVGGAFSGGLRGSPQEVDGLRFRSRVAAVEGDARRFVVSTSRAGRAPARAQEAGRVEAIRYCLTRFGGSEIGWTVSPDRPPEQLTLSEGGTLELSGRCLSR
jgi:hypothetical protein